MPRLTHHHRINAPSERVWSAIADFMNVHRFHPMVGSVDKLSAEDRGVGATRRCNFYDETSVVERITDWQEGESFSVELSNFSMPLKSASARMSVRAAGGGASEVSLTMDYVAKWGPLGWLMGVTMMRMMMKGMFRKVFEGLEHHILTGELVGQAGAPKSTAGGQASA